MTDRRSTAAHLGPALALVSLCALPVCAAAQGLRDRVKEGAARTLERIFKDQPEARTLFDQAYGYAVFDVRQASLALTAGHGNGVVET